MKKGLCVLSPQVISSLESEISEYQKRIEQDAAAICTLEERLNNIVKRNREYEAEVTTLTQQNSGKICCSVNE